MHLQRAETDLVNEKKNEIKYSNSRVQSTKSPQWNGGKAAGGRLVMVNW